MHIFRQLDHMSNDSNTISTQLTRSFTAAASKISPSTMLSHQMVCDVFSMSLVWPSKSFFGHCDTVHGRAVNIWAILDPYGPIAVDATPPWPAEVALHASALQDAVNRLCGPYLKPGLVAVSMNHLEDIRNGAALLSQSLGNANRHCQTAEQAVVHNNQAAYFSSSGHHEGHPSYAAGSSECS
jgi:hypothetical protein